MIKQILLDSDPFQFSLGNLPCMIHGAEHSGASLFTVTIIAQLYQLGNKLLFLSGYPMARDEFVNQTGNKQSVMATTSQDISLLEKNDAIFVLKENADLFIKLVQEITDIQERIIIIKNAELFDEKVYTSFSNFTKIIISGDIEKTKFKGNIPFQAFKTSVYFSPFSGVSLPDLPKHSGFLQSGNNRGIVSIDI